MNPDIKLRKQPKQRSDVTNPNIETADSNIRSAIEYKIQEIPKMRNMLKLYSGPSICVQDEEVEILQKGEVEWGKIPGDVLHCRPLMNR